MPYYLHCPKRYLKCYTLRADREYFSRPVLVEPLYSDVATRLLYVRDPARGHVYPTDPRDVRLDMRAGE